MYRCIICSFCFTVVLSNIPLQALLHNLTVSYNEFTLKFDEIINYKTALRKDDMLSLSKHSSQLLGIIDILKKDIDFIKEPGY